MAEQGLFFNAFPDSTFETGYDRNYNADDLSNWFSIVCDTGVVKGGLTLTAGIGLSVVVAAGKATIKGKGYINDAPLTLTLETAPVGSNSRYDLIVLRMDNTQTKSSRRSYLMTVKGTSDVPNFDDLLNNGTLVRNADIWDLMLGYVEVQPYATQITDSNITSKLGDTDFCPYFVATKGYDDYYDAIVQQYESNITLTAATSSVVTNIPTRLYNDKYSLVEVYCNGLKEENTQYSVNTDSGYITIVFTSQKNANAQISVVLNNFIDGEGLSTALSDYNNWVQDVATLKEAFEYTYVCNGLNDNVQITNLIKAFISAGTDYSSMNLKIVGNFGCNNGTSYPITVGGLGTTASPYQIFNIPTTNRRIILDFTNCSQISINVSGVPVDIFSTSNVAIKGLNLVANGTTSGTIIRAFSGNDDIVCEDCRFWINGYSGSMVAQGGTFTNCRASISNATGNAYCFLNTNLLRVNGGEYYAYTGSSSARSAIVGQSAANAVAILYGVSAPTLARSGYYQVNSIYQVGTGNYVNCTDLVSALALYVTTGYSNIRGTIALSK